MTDPFERAVAREQLERRESRTRHVGRGLRHHLRVYVFVNVMLVAIWLLTSGVDSHPWPVWSIGGWGIGLYFHWAHLREHERRDDTLRAKLNGV